MSADSSAGSSPELSLVIPAYNEATRLEGGFMRLNRAINEGALDPQTTQFIIVDDGSSDETAATAASLFGVFPNIEVIRQVENRGKGAAVRAGVAEATAPILIFADADMAIDPIQIPQFLAALEHSHMAIGSRAASGASVDRPSVTRSVMNRTFNHFVNTVTRIGLDDTQCGFKAFRRPMARLLFHCSTIERMAFDVEILGLARTLGLSIAQVPVHWSRVEGSRVRSWADSGSMVRDVLRVKKYAKSAPPIACSHFTLSGGARPSGIAFLQELAMSSPVVRLASTDFLVLFPLTSAGEATTLTAAIADRLGLPTPGLGAVTAVQLRGLAPLSLNWDGFALSSHPPEGPR